MTAHEVINTNGECEKINTYFEDENACVLTGIIQRLGQNYDKEPSQRYFPKQSSFLNKKII